MDFDLFRSIVNGASEIGVKRIHLYLHGEPMLHPRIEEMIQFIKSKDLRLSLTTNGMLFDRQRIRNILDSGLDSGDHIIFSLLGLSQETH